MAKPLRHAPMGVFEKILRINWLLIIVLSIIATVGVGMLFSAANGSWDPWAARHAFRYVICLVVLVAVAVIDIRLWFRQSYILYAGAFILLLAVEVKGFVGMGAQRWIDLGVISLQPSELMKIALVLVLARYFHSVANENLDRPLTLVPPLILITFPALLVLRQPDLGTAVLLVATGIAVLFVAGVRLRFFVGLTVIFLASLPISWQLLRGYQKARIMSFLDPESDALGAGYHIMQSKIAFGAGGLTGKGFLQGTQSHLSFLPEKQTDFIFTMLAEEFGLIGAASLIFLYLVVLAFGIAIAIRSRNLFGRFLGAGITTTFFLYVFINIAMVSGLVPVVGVPLPLISYGGTAMLTLMFGFGLLINVYVHRDALISPRGSSSV